MFLVFQVTVDNRNVRNWNVSWLRRFIGVVSQEPVLFATTIAENICYGQDGITQEDIEKATKMSNAHDFIQKLPHVSDINVVIKIHRSLIILSLTCRAMKLLSEKEELNSVGDKSNVLQLLVHWCAILKYFYLMRQPLL